MENTPATGNELELMKEFLDLSGLSDVWAGFQAWVKEYVAEHGGGTADSVAWDNITGKPDLALKSDIPVIRAITKEQIDALLAGQTGGTEETGGDSGSTEEGGGGDSGGTDDNGGTGEGSDAGETGA